MSQFRSLTKHNSISLVGQSVNSDRSPNTIVYPWWGSQSIPLCSHSFDFAHQTQKYIPGGAVSQFHSAGTALISFSKQNSIPGGAVSQFHSAGIVLTSLTKHNGIPADAATQFRSAVLSSLTKHNRLSLVGQ